ncbi:hypothetical protein BC628DRAFT_686340 [Trametes gibbosa]|nr:hypothetical protein BC628DRAFT_686340 [Trametes gibbosa]
MSATAVCETNVTQHSQHTGDSKSPGRYLWPSFSSLRASSSKRRSTALRIVTSESTPTLAQKPAASRTDPVAPGPGTVPVRASSDCPSTDTSASVTVAETVREQARLPESEMPATKTAKIHHVRAKSTTAVGELSLSLSHLKSSSTRTIPRPRASSSATMGTQPRPRPRLPSMLSTVLTNPRAPVQTRIASPSHMDLVGSFAPTSSPRERLLSLLSPTGAPSSHTPSGARSTRHASLRVSTARAHRPNPGPVARRRQSASSPIDAPPSPALPSICRTPSSYTGSEYFSTAPSSAGPATPVHTMAPLPPPLLTRKAESSSLHPVLEGLERTSMFAVRTPCASCGRNGSNFPCCPKCGEMWCSRACRLQKGNGKRHTCASRRA